MYLLPLRPVWRFRPVSTRRCSKTNVNPDSPKHAKKELKTGTVAGIKKRLGLK
jgi:hypothetical protein